ncbi:hypothetical protein FRACA_2620002 [Frankia canadensis]|uniref:Uncharacterized protein n=1 Tax=Frankia canadensis TaxID=1836972 RepID=A0A2I2KSH4_9ACTN|nr:hypothetical protein FRACA_2620002 [Frankia canadensis]SOU55918.1 hypothetical protein FRACA_2620002 [Frankia canadensis]
MPGVLRLLQQRPPPFRDRTARPDGRPPRPGRDRPHGPRRRPGRRLHGPTRTVRPPATGTAAATETSLDQPTRTGTWAARHGYRSKDSVVPTRSCLVQVDGFRPDLSLVPPPQGRRALTRAPTVGRRTPHPPWTPRSPCTAYWFGRASLQVGSLLAMSEPGCGGTERRENPSGFDAAGTDLVPPDVGRILAVEDWPAVREWRSRRGRRYHRVRTGDV